jgi:hypothetical protein
MKLAVFYRISDSGNKKEKLAGAGKQKCLENALRVFEREHFYIRADHCSDDTLQMLDKLSLKPEVSQLGNAGSWLASARQALSNDFQGFALYFLEDDYLHLPDSGKIILDGLSRADYVSLYDHPDKYQTGPNPFADNQGEICRVLPGKYCHWKTSNSTTMTFAVKQQTLKEDFSLWERHCMAGFPNDFEAYLELQAMDSWENRIGAKKRKLVTSLPAWSTHTETEWLSPLRNWTELCS